jgi:phenylacetate-coenzyme A ligase PaaK-like adenylate-forming protein
MADDRYERNSQDLLNQAMAEVPFYKEHWSQYDPGSACPADERYAALPVLTKSDMRASFPDGLVPYGTDVEQGLKDNQIEYTFTSGTTGDKVINLWNQDWWHASEMASWKLNSNLAKLSYPPRQATLASSLNVGISCEEDLPMDHRIMGNLLYLNEKANIMCWKAFHLERMAEELNTYRPTVLEANPSLLARACRYWIRHGIHVYSPDVITSTYELPSNVSLKVIRKVFDSPLVSSYGSTETGFVMDTDEHGIYLQNTEYCRIDALPLKEEYGGPDLARLAVSTFHNPWAYIIRFDVGDLVKIEKNHTGSGIVALRIEGRASNATFTTEGRLITTAMTDDAMCEIDSLADYDLTQTAANEYDVKLVLLDHEEDALKQADLLMKHLYGENGIYHIQAVKDLLPGPAGKYRRTHTAFAFDDWNLVKGDIRHAK